VRTLAVTLRCAGSDARCSGAPSPVHDISVPFRPAQVCGLSRCR